MSFQRFDPDAYLQTYGGRATKVAKAAKVGPDPATEKQTLATLSTLAGVPPRDYLHAGAPSWGGCVARWLLENPPASTNPDSGCAHCGKAEAPGTVILPFLAGNSGHVWLHDGCWPDWYAGRQAEATAAVNQSRGGKP